MRITLTTSGGFAGNLRRPPCTVETDRLGPGAQAELTALLARARAESEQSGPAPTAPRRPDALGFAITLGDADRPILHGSEGSLPPAFAELLRWLRAHGD